MQSIYLLVVCFPMVCGPYLKVLKNCYFSAAENIVLGSALGEPYTLRLMVYFEDCVAVLTLEHSQRILVLTSSKLLPICFLATWGSHFVYFGLFMMQKHIMVDVCCKFLMKSPFKTGYLFILFLSRGTHGSESFLMGLCGDRDSTWVQLPSRKAPSLPHVAVLSLWHHVNSFWFQN